MPRRQVRERNDETQILKNRAILKNIFKNTDQLDVARRETGRKRKETPAMAEFMNEQLTKSKRGRKPKAIANSHLESDLTSTSSTTTTTSRTEAELQAEAIRLHDVPHDQWPDDVRTYQRDADRNRKRKAAEMQLEDDRLRREVEQQRRQEQLAKMAADEPEGESRQPRQRSVEYGNRTKRQRQSEVDAANAVPADLMNDDEIEAARTAPLTAPNEAQKQHIVNRTRGALSEHNQGQRVCAVCDECVFKNESRIGPFCQAIERGRCSSDVRSLANNRHSTPRLSLCTTAAVCIAASQACCCRKRRSRQRSAKSGESQRQRCRHAVRLWQAESQRHRVQRADVDLHHVRIVADAQHFEERHRRQRR